MAMQSLRADDSIGPVGPTARPQADNSRKLKYQLNVIGSTVAEVVESCGGWLFDRAMAGWEVNVVVGDDENAVAARILGARTPAFDVAMASDLHGADCAAGLAVAADQLVADRRVHDEVRTALRNGLTEVAVWGRWPAQLAGRAESVHHPLSAAARVYKRHALVAAGRGEVPVEPIERLFRGGYRPLDSDLLTG